MSTPLVSICCLAYNHESYIRECLDGFLMQETDFDFEILIHDDASTDKTADIIREYELKHPDIIKPIYQTENQYSKGVRPTFSYNIPRAKGIYIALCEGDDYWTDPLKLQKQVDLLEEHTDCSGCFTNANIINELDNSKTIYVKRVKEGKVREKTIILRGGGLYPTASLVFRKSDLKLDNFSKYPAIAGDELLVFELSRKGSLYFLNEITCVYHIWKGGVYSSVVASEKLLSDYDIQKIQGYKSILINESRRRKRYFKRKISQTALKVIRRSDQITNYPYLRMLHPKELLKLVAHIIIKPIYLIIGK